MRHCRCWGRSIATAVSLFLSFFASGAWADDQALFRAHLAAGEFGPAKLLAAKQTDPAARDRWLKDLAMAQAQGGSRAGATATSYAIGSDRTRRELARDLRGLNRGGGVQADFDSLMELIRSTIAPSSWTDVGGPGSIEPFQGGVRVDSQGLLAKVELKNDASLARLREQSATVAAASKDNPRRSSPLRKISLRRLEQAVQARYADGLPPDEAQRYLAGLQRVQYVFVYPETGDVVLSGPAGDWQIDAEGRVVSVDGGRAVTHLDDLVVVLRNAFSAEGKFGCSITPTKQGLAACQAVGDKWAAAPLKPGQRDKWLEEMRAALGKQDIEVYGIDPRTRAALVLVEADYRMKRVGMGLEPGTVGVASYFSYLDGGNPKTLDVLRWWFALNYDALRTTEARNAFAFRGTGAKVLSENELLTPTGDRVHTGQSKEPTRLFAEGFTKQFDLLAAKYPVYGELRNIFDLAVAAAVMKQQDIPNQLGWEMTHFGPDGDYEPTLGTTPKQVDSIVNHRLINGKTIVAGISGGVRCDPRALVEPTAIQVDRSPALREDRQYASPPELPVGRWWWD